MRGKTERCRVEGKEEKRGRMQEVSRGRGQRSAGRGEQRSKIDAVGEERGKREIRGR